MLNPYRIVAFVSLFTVTTVWSQGINTHLFKFGNNLDQITLEDAMGKNSELSKYKGLIRVSFDHVEDSIIGINIARNTQLIGIVDQIQTLSFGGGFFLSPRVFVGLDVPLHKVRLSSQYISGNFAQEQWTLGDSGLHIKFRLSQDQAKTNIAIMPYFFFPTGDRLYFVSDDSYGVGARFIFDRQFLPNFKMFAHLGYAYASNAQVLSVDRRSRVEGAAGAFLGLGKNWGLTGEMITAVTFPNFDDDQNPLEVRLGIRGKFGRVHAFAGGGLEGFRETRSNQMPLYGGFKLPVALRNVPKPKPVIVPKPVIKPKPAPKPKKIVKSIEILRKKLSVRREINFETSRAVIKEDSYAELDSAAAIIKEYQDQIGLIVIEGHTDTSGSASYNRQLSNIRADAVKRYLISKGVDESKLKSIGYGESRPKVKEITDKDRAINRRVEFVLEQVITKEIEREIEQ